METIGRRERYVRVMSRLPRWYWPWPKYKRMDTETYREKVSASMGMKVEYRWDGFYVGESKVGPIFGFWDEKAEKL